LTALASLGRLIERTDTADTLTPTYTSAADPADARATLRLEVRRAAR
jgi:hypothetical protein